MKASILGASTHPMQSLLSALLMAQAVAPWGAYRLDAADPVADYTLHECTVSVSTEDGKPLPRASVYGFCREYNLLWPRHRAATAPARTGRDGKVRVIVPGGKWQFLAVAQVERGRGILATWSEERVAQKGEVISLRPTATRRWSLCSVDGAALAPKCVYLRPDGFPLWIPATFKAPTDTLHVRTSKGEWQFWAEGDGTSERPGFAMAWGPVSEATPNGKLPASGQHAVIECQGADGPAWLEWDRKRQHGLQGEVALNPAGRVWVTPGEFAISYRRPVTAGLVGSFAAETYALKPGQLLKLRFDGLLAGGLVQAWAADSAKPELFARLYLVDVNGHPLDILSDSRGHRAPIPAALWLDGQKFPVSQLAARDETIPGCEAGYTLFAAHFSQRQPVAGATWEFQAPPGLLRSPRLTADAPVTVQTRTFETDVPQVMAHHARNVLEQADAFAETMNDLTGRKRTKQMTKLRICPGHHGGSATHDGSRIQCGSILFYLDALSDRHTFAHELGHNFGMTHSGLLETVVEAARCGGGPDTGQQPAKWAFVDLLNGRRERGDAPHNRGVYAKGLYMYCYAQGGAPSLHFLVANEAAVNRALGKRHSGYSDDEIMAAMLSLALGRDMTSICAASGMAVNSSRVAQATRAARVLCMK